MSFSTPTPDPFVDELSDREDGGLEMEEENTLHNRLLRMGTSKASLSVHRQIARLRESIPSDDESDLSPIGSPRAGAVSFGGREKFFELRRKLQEDQLNRPKIVSNISDFENLDNLNWEGVVDVEALLQTIHDEQGGKEQSYASISLNESNPKFVEMHEQIKERDIKLLNLESRLNEMDRQVIDLQDTVSQRDKVISSKNEAVAVIQEKFRKDVIGKEEELKKTQKTLFEMEKILSSTQIQWKSEKENLNLEIQKQIERIATLHETNKALEAKNYEFSQRESEKESLQNSVQEKIEELNLKNSQIDELTTELDNSKSQIPKLKVQYQNKLKSFKAKHKELTEKDPVKLVEMENRITELEEEKGNLLLQLMDFDEQQAAHSGLKNHIYEMESKARTDEEMVSSLTENLSKLQEENSNLSSSLERSREEVAKLSASLIELEKSSEESRVTLEMRVVELEEERDAMTQESVSLTEGLRETFAKLTSAEKEIQQIELKTVSSVTVCTDTLDLVTTCEQTTTTMGVDQNEIGAKRARVSSGYAPTTVKENEQILTGKASSLFSTPGKPESSLNEHMWSGWNEPPPAPFQYVNLDEEAAENLAPVASSNVFQHSESNREIDLNTQVVEGNQWPGWGGFDDTTDTFVQVKSPFSYVNNGESMMTNRVEEENPCEIESLQNQLRILTSICDNLKSNLASKTFECEKLEQKVDALNLDCERLYTSREKDDTIKHELIAKDTELAKVQSELEKAKENLKSKESDLESTAACIVEIRSELEDKLCQIASSLHVIESFKLNLTEKDAVIIRLTSDLSNSELVTQEKCSTVTDLLENLEENSRVIHGLRNELKNIQGKYEEMLNNWEERETTTMMTMTLKNQVAQMREDLCHRDEELEELRNKLTESNNLLDANEIELIDLRSRENDMIGGYQKLSEEFDKLQITFEQTKSQLDNSRRSTDTNRGYEEQLEERITPLKITIAELEVQLKTLNEKSGKTEEKLKKAMIMLKQKNIQLAELRKVPAMATATSFSEEQTGSGPQSLSPLPLVDNQKEVEKWQSECTEKDTKLGQLQTVLHDLQCQVNDLTLTKVQALELAKNEEEKITELRDMLNKNEGEMLRLKEIATVLEGKALEADSKQVEMEQLLASFNAVEMEVQKLQTELTNKSNQLEHMVNLDQFNEVMLQRDELQESLNLRILNIAHLESKIDETLALTQAQIQFLEKETGDKNNMIFQLSSEVSRLQSDIVLVETQREQWQQAVTVERAEKENLIQKICSLENERDSYLEKINTLELLKSELSLKDEIISKVKETQENLELSNEENNNLRDQLNTAVNKFQTVISEMDEINKSVVIKDNIIQNLNNNLLILEAEKQTISSEMEKLQKELVVLQETANQSGKVIELESALSDSKGSVTLLKLQLHELDQNYNRLNDELQKSREDALCLQHDREKTSHEWQTKITDLMNQLTNTDTEFSLLSQQFQQEKLLNTELKSILDVKTKQLDVAEDLLSQNALRITHLEENLNQLKSTHAAELHEISFENTELIRKVSHMQQQLDDTAAELESFKRHVYNVEESQIQAQNVNFFQTETQPLQSQFQIDQNLLQMKFQTQEIDLGVPEGMCDLDLVNQKANIQELENKIKILQNELNLTTERLQQAAELQLQFDALSFESELLFNENSTLKQELNLLKLSAASNKESPKVIKKGIESEVESFLNWDAQISGKDGMELNKKRADTNDWWKVSGGNVDVVEEPIVKMKSFVTNSSVDSIEDSLKADLQLKDNKIYELEVQLTELEINLQDANSQLNNLNSDLEMVSLSQNRLKEENHVLVQEVESLKRARSEAAIEFENRSITSSQIVEAAISSGTFETMSGTLEEEKNKLLTELRDLKLRNGKTLQRLKQLSDKYTALTKEHESLKTKNQFSLENTLEDEFLKQIEEKDGIIAENSKNIAEFLLERNRMTEKIDLLELANEKIIDMNENQKGYCQQLENQKRQLDQEISGLKWRLEEIENTSVTEPSHTTGLHESIVLGETTQHDAAMIAAAQEIQLLQQENIRLNSIVQMLNNTPQEAIVAGGGDVSSLDIEILQNKLENELSEKIILERKIELLQGKILEIEQSEIKCFEEALMLKSWTRQLEMDNLKYQKELEQIYNSVSDGDMNNLKVKTLQNEVMRLVETLHDRDKRCEELTMEITRMLEERDGLQLKLSNVLQHNVSLHEEANKGKDSPTGDIPSFDKEVLKMKLAELEGVNFAIKIDLRREREARRLVQEQLLFSQSSRVYRDLTSRNKITFSSPSPPPKLRSTSPPQSPSIHQEPIIQGPQVSILPSSPSSQQI